MIGGFSAYAWMTVGEIQSLLMIGMIVLIALAGLLGGIIPALFNTIVCLFFFGTYSLINTRNESLASLNEIFYDDLLPILVWFIIAVLIATISGQSTNKLMKIVKENKYWRERYDELVQIDLDTGFDNDKRFSIVVMEEYKRTERYGGNLSLLMVEMQYHEQFIELYGEKEFRFVAKKISDHIRSNVRISDRKFRLKPNRFAIILTETPVENIMVVVKKINSLITEMELSDKKTKVTLTIHYGMAGFEQKFNSWTEFVAHAENDISSNYTM